MTPRRIFGSLLVVALCACEPGAGHDAPTPSAGTSPVTQPATEGTSGGERAEALLKIELTRNVSGVTAEDLSNRDVVVRRSAARALARARDEAAIALLTRALLDEDEQVVAWAAYGLGDVCAGRRDDTVSALAASAAMREGKPGDGNVDAMRAITRAVGRCAGAESERTLTTWARLRGPYSLDAIYALGDLAREHKRLREDTYVALLELAEGNVTIKPIPEALYPIGRVDNLTPSVIERTREVAKARLEQPGVGRAFAVRALGRTDEAAVPLLQQVLADPSRYAAAERAEAATALTRFGRDGQKALQEAVDKLVPATDALSATSLVSPDIGPLLIALEGLTDTRKAKPTLERLARLPAPPEAPKSVERRLSWIRCTAAKLLAERDYANADLRACDLSVPAAGRATDPIAGSIGARAIVEALGVDAVKIAGPRLEVWRKYAEGGDIRARQAAIAQLKEHFEIRESAEILAKALGAKEAGVVATAAEIITANPIRAVKREAQPKKDSDDKSVPEAATLHEPLVTALVAHLDGTGPTEDLEALSAVIDAAGTLGLNGAKEKLVSQCSSPHRNVREHAEKALAKIMGKASPRCSAGKQLGPPIELEHRITSATKIVLTTDAGDLILTLDPTLAPVAATRAVDLAKNKFYDGMVVHRVVPGFVTQFGSPTFDGYGGVAGLPPLPCETSPIPFAPLTVGVALAGRDTGSSQLFVTHAPTPHLDGNYALIGTATGPWDALIDGDVIQSVKVE